ncbi:MAG TPA: hypothetical protein DCP54_02010 [Chryseobacterium sp.]|nr:hypothetical protein [Chryseobacterium sp.]
MLMVGLINGCGACGGFWKFFRPPHHSFFKNECNLHDKHYDIGGNRIDRKIADLILYNNMQKNVKIYFKGRKPISRFWFLILCKCYYLGVRIFGFSNFKYN